MSCHKDAPKCKIFIGATCGLGGYCEDCYLVNDDEKAEYWEKVKMRNFRASSRLEGIDIPEEPEETVETAMNSEYTLNNGEPHPMARDAMDYVKHHLNSTHTEAIASSALAGNRTAEVCLGTIRRLQKGMPVSDRYIMGLAWFIKHFQDMVVVGGWEEQSDDCLAEELQLLRKVHWDARTVMRYYGVDSNRTAEAWNALERSVDAVIRFDHECGDD